MMLLVPLMGPFLFAGGILLALWLLVKALVPALRDESRKPVDPMALKLVCGRIQNTVKGACPACHEEIMLTPPETSDELFVYCPLCRAALHYRGGYVRVR